VREIVFTIVVVFLGAMLAFFIFLGPPIDPALLKVADFQYADAVKISCISGTKKGNAGKSDGIETKSGASYNLRTPKNYRATYAHPLIVVYAPAGTSANKSERHVHLTQQATQAGYVIAYANKLRMSLKAIKKLATIPDDVQNKWCIDPTRIFFTGHSDGGTITNALTFLPNSSAKPTAIAPSAAGMNADSLTAYECPSPLPVMVFHNSQDSHFEGFGKQAAHWWANCNQCSSELTEVDQHGCRAYIGCSDDAKTYYCEGRGSHSDWPNKNNVLINFFNDSH
jgi:polyhydroxybutyrate depolymerase